MPSTMDPSHGVSRKRKFSGLGSNEVDLPIVATDSNTLNSPSEVLCDRCSEIDIDEIFTRKIKKSSFVLHLGSIEDLRASQCRLCHVFASMAPTAVAQLTHSSSLASFLATGRYHLRVFSASWALTGCLGRSTAAAHVQEVNILGVAPTKNTTEALADRGDEYDLRIVLRQTGYLSLESSLGTSSNSICQVRMLESRRFDLDLTKEWISYCEHKHRTLCSRKALPKPVNVRVFDCRNRRVIDAPEGCDYIALSYVWGKSGTDDHSTRLDKVIEDSVTVTLGLGMQYLWADKICIDQFDEENKRHQIRQMDLIYAHSALTVIAAAGNGPDHGLPGINGTRRDHGLPGINGTRRIEQQRVTVRNQRLISTLPSGQYSVETSKWQTRGWTFQEGILSTRRLFFTENQVLFECNSMHCSEAYNLHLDSLHTSNTRKFDIFAYDMGAIPAKTPGATPADFMAYISDYAKRSLSYRADTLNAIQGVLNAFQRAKNPVYSFWGVPIFLSDEHLHRGRVRQNITRSRAARFVISLFWYGESTTLNFVRTRVGFPSWSWSAWSGGIGTGLLNSYSNRFADVNVWFEDEHKNLTHIEDIHLQPHMTALEDTFSSILRVEGQTLTLSLEYLQFTAEEKSDWAKKKKRPSYVKGPEDGFHVSLDLVSGGTLYSRLCYYDASQAYPPDQVFMGLLPLARNGFDF